MPKGHPISVPRTWPGHRDYGQPCPKGICHDPVTCGNRRDCKLTSAPRGDDEPVIELRGEAAKRAAEIIARRQRERYDALPREAKARIGVLPECPVPGGTCELCDDDHCREL